VRATRQREGHDPSRRAHNAPDALAEGRASLGARLKRNRISYPSARWSEVPAKAKPKEVPLRAAQ
jgi:hypothetical protein